MVSALLFGLGVLMLILRAGGLATVTGIGAMTLAVILSATAFGRYAETNQGDLLALVVVIVIAMNGLAGFVLFTDEKSAPAALEEFETSTSSVSVVQVESADG